METLKKALKWIGVFVSVFSLVLGAIEAIGKAKKWYMERRLADAIERSDPFDGAVRVKMDEVEDWSMDVEDFFAEAE